MAEYKIGAFTLQLEFHELGRAEFGESERQFAWEIYCELTATLASTGAVDSRGTQVFTGELFCQGMESLSGMCEQMHSSVKAFPMGRLADRKPNLGYLVKQLLEVVIRPFLRKWKAAYAHWLSICPDAKSSPFLRQERYPLRRQLQEDWTTVRDCCRSVAVEIAKVYGFIDVLNVVPGEQRDGALSELAGVVAACGKGPPDEYY